MGCAGQDGSLMCNSLLKKGERIIGLSRSHTNKIPNHIQLGIDKNIELKKGDVTNFLTIAELIETYKPDKIFNFAAQSSVGKSFNSPLETVESIVTGTMNILEVARKLEFSGKIFFAGSSEMFGLTKVGANINHNQNPKNPYGIAKQTSFNLVKFYRKNYKINCVTGVLFNHESQLRPSDFVTQKIIEGVIQARKNRTHKITLGNVEIKRDWGWAEEYIEAMLKITEASKVEDHVICTGKATSLIEFVKISFRKLGLNWEDHVVIDNKLKRKNEILQSFGDPDPIEKKLNWKAKVSVDEIITKLLEQKMKYTKRS